MLREMLRLLASGDTKTLNDFSTELGVAPEVVEEALERLRSMGYVEDLASVLRASCADGCASGPASGGRACGGCTGCGAGCGMASNRGSQPKARVWCLTKKGKIFSGQPER